MTLEQTDSAPYSQGAHAALQGRRVRVIVSLMLAAVVVRLLAALVGDTLVPMSLGITVAFAVALLIARVFNNRGESGRAMGLVLISAFLVLCLLALTNEGIHDTALFGLPAIMICSGLFFRRREYLALVVAIFSFLVFLTWCSVTGHIVRGYTPSYSPIDRALDIILIFAVSAGGLYVLINDLRKSLATTEDALTALRRANAEVVYLSQHDPLTQLPNRMVGKDRIEQALHVARRHQSRLAVIFVDLDNFKAINDALGHDAGDSYLVHVARQLVGAVRQTDVVSRQGGDEFVIGITGARDLQDIRQTAEKIIASVASPITLQGQTLSPSCSLGIAVFPEDGEDYATLLHHADHGMYRAKRAGRNTYQFYQPLANENP